MASPIVFPFGPGQGTDNVTGLAAAAAKVLGQVGTNQGIVFDYTVAPILIKTGTGATGGTVDILIAVSETSGATGIWTDGIDPTLSSDQSAKISNQMVLAKQILVEQPSTSYRANAFGIFNTLG